MKIKICIWMNMPSHHQSAFFKALANQQEVDLQIRYYEKVDEDRKKLGWSDSNNIPSNQKFIANIQGIEESLPDWKERIHIVPGFSSPFLKKLLNLIVAKKLKWIHWSERSGVGLAKLLHFNYRLFNLFYPIFLYAKGYKSYAKQINNTALGALAIGELARKDFFKWGVDNKKIEYLPYSLDALAKPKEIIAKLRLANEKLFMYVGALDERKGINILIESFYKLSDGKKWKLVLVGADRSNSKYIKQAKKLGIENQVSFVGVVKSNNINEYLAQADVFVLPTLFDGWGAVLNEAASLSKPLISTDQAGSAYHLIENEQNGFMAKAGSVASLSRAMQYYVNNLDKIELHGKRSYELFQNLTPEASAEQFVSHVKKFLDDKQ